MCDMKIHKIGEEIEGKLVNANQIQLIHKQDIAGCCHPSVNWCCCACLCPSLKSRSYNWVGEHALLTNTAFCTVCGVVEFGSISHFDDAPYTPCCECLGSPCGERGYVTGSELNSPMCNRCMYEPCCKPCYGESVSAVPCENGTCCFKVGTCCPCCMAPVGGFLSDANAYRAAIILQASKVRGKELTDVQKELIQSASPEMVNMVR